MNKEENKTDYMKKKAREIREQTLEMCALANSGHISSSFSCTEILVALYYGGILRVNPHDTEWEDRDRFIVSKGHGGIALYPILADLGFFDKKELTKYCKGGILGAHPDKSIPGIEVTTGSLGHGIGIGIGLALSAKMDKKGYMTVVLMGDAECYEGTTWEGALLASHHKLNNLVCIIDRNMLSATDFTEDFMKLELLHDKWLSFGWDVFSIRGHSFSEILNVFKYPHNQWSSKPLMIIAYTTKGKGISMLENNPLGHTLIPRGTPLETAKEELEQ